MERIHAKTEFRKMMSNLKNNLEIEMNFTLPGKHVPTIERYNQVLQERYVISLYRIPFKMIVWIMIHYLTLRVTTHINYLPAHTSI